MTSIRKTAIWAVAGLTGLTLLTACGGDDPKPEATGGPVDITVAMATPRPSLRQSRAVLRTSMEAEPPEGLAGSKLSL